MSYEIFLSYAHADAEKYGQEYIDEIKRQIEDSIGEQDIVFLDVIALEDGNEWNSKIQSSLDQSKVFIYLLSENYLKSEYCTRERIWWAQREMKRGRLHKATLPVFYVQIETNDPKILSKKETALYLQANADKPWFPDGSKAVAEELVKERLNIARIQQLKNDFEIANQSFSSIPPYNLKFVGRIPELCRIRQICSHSGMDIDSIPVLHGEAGCGKSELSFAYAHGYASEYPGGRFFIPMEHVKDWKSAWLKLADEIDKKTGIQIYKVLGLNEDDRKASPEVFEKLLEEYMLRHIINSGRTLILLDNIDYLELLSEAGLKEMFPTEEIPDNLDIIATTRPKPVLEGCSKAVAVPIGNLGEDAALELLRLHCGAAPFNLAPPENDTTTADAKELLAFLKYHAWSVEIIAGYLGQESKFGTNPQKILEDLKKNFEIKKTYQSFRNIPNCIEKLLQPTIDRIKEQELGNEILDLAGVMAMFAPDRVSVKLLKMFWIKCHGKKVCSHADSWLFAWETLKDYHLISTENNDIARTHRITQRFFLSYYKSKQQELAENIKDIINEADISVFSSEDAKSIAGLAEFILNQSWNNCFFSAILYWIDAVLLAWYRLEESQLLLANLKRSVNAVDDFTLKADLLDVQGDFYSASNQHISALKSHNKSLKIRLEVLPENHPDVAASYNNIGNVYGEMGNYEKALENSYKSLKILLEVLPENHRNIATLYNNIGCIYGKMGNYEKALENHFNALKIRSEVLPENHPDVAASYNNIGNVYDEMGNYEKALENSYKSLKILLEVLPKNHPNTATLYNNIGNVYDKMGNYEKALENHFNALKIRSEVLPENHPDVAASYNNIGNVYDKMDNYEKALENHFNALKIQSKVLPENHPDVAASYNEIGYVYGEMGNYEKALENHFNALKIRSEVLPENHPDVAASYYGIGNVYGKMGNYEKALENFYKSLKILLEVLPENHPNIATLYNNIGCVYDKMGNYEKALENFYKSLKIRSEVPPENHPDVAISYNNIGSVYDKMGNYEKALENHNNLLKVVLEIYIKNLGKDAPETQQLITTLNTLQRKLRWMRWWKKLKRLFRK